MTAKKAKTTAKKTTKKKAAAKPVSAAQEGLQVTWRLKGDLKRAQRAYLRIGEQLVHVRDAKLFAALKHPDMEDYAQQRLGLGRASLQRYLVVYEWARQNHPEWLAPNAKGLIPDLSDCSDLMWIEAELKKPNQEPARQAALLDLQKKGLAGTLRQAEVRAFRRQRTKGTDSVKAVLSKLRAARRQLAALKNTPAEALQLLDRLVDVLKNDHTLQLAGIHEVIPVEDPVRRNFVLA